MSFGIRNHFDSEASGSPISERGNDRCLRGEVIAVSPHNPRLLAFVAGSLSLKKLSLHFCLPSVPIEKFHNTSDQMEFSVRDSDWCCDLSQSNTSHFLNISNLNNSCVWVPHHDAVALHLISFTSPRSARRADILIRTFIWYNLLSRITSFALRIRSAINERKNSFPSDTILQLQEMTKKKLMTYEFFIILRSFPSCIWTLFPSWFRDGKFYRAASREPKDRSRKLQ